MEKIILQKGYYSSKSSCPKCHGIGYAGKWYRERYDSKHDALEYRCFGCGFKFIEYIDSGKGQDSNVQNNDNDESILIDDKMENVNVLIEGLKSKINKLHETVNIQNQKIMDLEKMINQILKEQRLSKVNIDEKVNLDDLDNFKI